MTRDPQKLKTMLSLVSQSCLIHTEPSEGFRISQLYFRKLGDLGVAAKSTNSSRKLQHTVNHQ
jgi:hypothetical protein